MKTKIKKSRIELLIEFIKLQLAGNIPFWGTYGGFALLDQVFKLPHFYALAIPTILANALFFVVDDKWVFANARGKRKSPYEVVKFMIFMSFSALLLFVITYSLEQYFGITPYLGQFISGFFATAWTFIGLRFWVFAPPHHHRIFINYAKSARPKARRRRSIKTTA